MFSNRLAFAVLGIACVTAAGGGAYLATRQTDAVPVAADTPAVVQEASLTAPVTETEALIEATPAPVEAAPVPQTAAPKATPKAPARQPEPVRNAPVQPAQARVEPPPTVERNRPAPAISSNPSSIDTLPPVEAAPAPRTEELRAPEPARAPEPPRPTFHDLVVSADSVLGLQLESTITSERARIEDRVDARVVRDVRVNGEVAIPAGSRAIGSVTAVERGGKMKERARLGIRFHTLVLADGTEIPMTSETIYRNGDAPGNGSAAKIGGGAVAGAILGAIIGGAKGAAIGGSAGAGAGTAAVMAGERSVASFPTGSEVTARIVSPVTVTVEK